jgi:hypothetical protein
MFYFSTMKDTYLGGLQSKKVVSKISLMKTVPLNLFFLPSFIYGVEVRDTKMTVKCRTYDTLLASRAWFSTILVPVLTSTSWLYFLKGPSTMEAALESWMLTVHMLE